MIMEILNFFEKIRTDEMRFFPVKWEAIDAIAEKNDFDLDILQYQNCSLKLTPVWCTPGIYTVNISLIFPYQTGLATRANNFPKDKTYAPPTTIDLEIKTSVSGHGENIKYTLTSRKDISGTYGLQQQPPGNAYKVQALGHSGFKLEIDDLTTPDNLRNWICAYFSRYYYLFYVHPDGNPTIIPFTQSTTPYS